MQFPRWLKLLYWGLLFIGSTWLLGYRYAEGDPAFPTQVDTAVAVVWLAMAFAPLFSEFSVGALSLKQEVQNLKAEVKDQLLTLRSEFSVATQIQSQLHQQISVQVPTPPPDSQLPALEERIRRVIREEVGSRLEPGDQKALADVPSDVHYLFTVRYALERELRRLGRGWADEGRRPMSVIQIARDLVRFEAISPEMADSIRQVYAVCSPAVHGEMPTSDQISFVREVGPEIIAALRVLEQRRFRPDAAQERGAG